MRKPVPNQFSNTKERSLTEAATAQFRAHFAAGTFESVGSVSGFHRDALAALSLKDGIMPDWNPLIWPLFASPGSRPTSNRRK